MKIAAWKETAKKSCKTKCEEIGMKTYNLVNSVKGGCGKTTFSIWLSCYLGMSEEKEVEQTILVDMDLLGTSMQSVFFGKKEMPDEYAFVNEIFDGKKESSKPFVHKIRLANGQLMNVIFSSTKMEDRIKFKSGDYSSYTPIVKHSIFRSGLKELIKNNQKLYESEVKHFVFDMPPNSDGFSDAAMECIFNPRHSVARETSRNNLFVMIGSEWGQTVATAAEVKAILTRRDARMPDKIFFVINNNVSGDFDSEQYKKRKDYLKEEIASMKLTEEETEKIYFLKMTQSRAYTQMGIDALGIVNADKDKIIEAVPRGIVEEIASFKEEFKIVKENALRILITNEKPGERKE